MPKAVGVIFSPGGKVNYYDPEDFVLVPGDEVIVPATRGVEYAKVVTSPREIPSREGDRPLKKVLRKATKMDREQLFKNLKRKKEVQRECQRLIEKHNLDMKLVDTEYVFDGSSITFYFTADGRVDFRELVKDLAGTLKTRIELRQVGVRDEAKMVGGLGPCGRDLCCSMFLSDFEPVSIKMAKEQDLPLNPSKISGICGRLMCCLKYEVETYEEFNQMAPHLGSRVEMDEGEGVVVGYQVPLNKVIVELEGGRRIPVPLEHFRRRKPKWRMMGRKRKKVD